MIYKMLIVYTLISVAVIMDCKYYKIPNSINLWGLISVIFFNVFLEDRENILDIASGILIPFGLLYPVYKIGGIGAGDIKLLCVIGGVVGMKSSLRFTVFCFVMAGIIGIVKLIFLRIKNQNKKLFSSKIHFSYAIFATSIIEPIVNHILKVNEGGFL